MNPLLVALKGKGLRKTFNRVRTLGNRYGLNANKMDRALEYYGEVLSEYHCGATFPITAAALARSSGVIEKFQNQNIEFAVHGYYHVDHTQLSVQQQVSDFSKARRLFEERGLKSAGFRSPYLRCPDSTLKALGEAGFLYDSSRSLVWGVVKDQETESYQRVLEFYCAKLAKLYPSLPRLEKGIVEIPYCLPDDESLIERLRFDDYQDQSPPWMGMLQETYRLGELFTLGLHPERIFLCEASLRKVLQTARSLSPAVYIARLDEIAKWWAQRAAIKTTVVIIGTDEYRLETSRLSGLTVLARKVEVIGPSQKWDDRYVRATGDVFQFRTLTRPVIGISPSSDLELEAFLRQQGYIIEIIENATDCSIFFHRPHFTREDERALLAEIERVDKPLIKLGRWPHGAKSALCITGDIDALTIWDYGLRFLGE